MRLRNNGNNDDQHPTVIKLQLATCKVTSWTCAEDVALSRSPATREQAPVSVSDWQCHPADLGSATELDSCHEENLCEHKVHAHTVFRACVCMYTHIYIYTYTYCSAVPVHTSIELDFFKPISLNT